MSIFRGSWIPVSGRPNNQRFLCPFCGERVYMPSGSPTYPTCPWCISDMPEADDFETPEELEKRKAGNKGATGKKYSESREDNEEWRAKRREYYAKNSEHFREYKRQYYEENREKINAQHRERNKQYKERNREYARRYYQEHREEILAAAKMKRKANPEKYREHQQRCKGKSMREVEAHIRGVPVEDIPRNGFYFGKGVQREK